MSELSVDLMRELTVLREPPAAARRLQPPRRDADSFSRHLQRVNPSEPEAPAAPRAERDEGEPQEDTALSPVESRLAHEATGETSQGGASSDRSASSDGGTEQQSTETEHAKAESRSEASEKAEGDADARQEEAKKSAAQAADRSEASDAEHGGDEGAARQKAANRNELSAKVNTAGEGLKAASAEAAAAPPESAENAAPERNEAAARAAEGQTVPGQTEPDTTADRSAATVQASSDADDTSDGTPNDADKKSTNERAEADPASDAVDRAADAAATGRPKQDGDAEDRESKADGRPDTAQRIPPGSETTAPSGNSRRETEDEQPAEGERAQKAQRIETAARQKVQATGTVSNVAASAASAPGDHGTVQKDESPNFTNPSGHSAVESAVEPADTNDTDRLEPIEVRLADERKPAARRPAPAAQASRSGAESGVDRSRFVQRITRAIEVARQRGGEVRLRLSPPELGSVRLEVEVRDGLLHARVETESSTARTLILENLTQLRERLSQQEIKIGRFDVDLMQEQSSGHEPGQRQQEALDQQSARGQTNHGVSGSRTVGGGVTEHETEQQLSRVNLGPDGQLNVVI